MYPVLQVEYTNFWTYVGEVIDESELGGRRFYPD